MRAHSHGNQSRMTCAAHPDGFPNRLNLALDSKQFVTPLNRNGEHTREQPRLNLPTLDYENAWETVETIDLWVADRKSVG